MNLRRWRSHPWKSQENVPPCRRTNWACTVGMSQERCIIQRACVDKQRFQTGRWTCSFPGLLQQYGFDCIPSTHLGSNSTHVQPGVQAFGRWRVAGSALYGWLHSTFYSRYKHELGRQSYLYQLFLLIFDHRKASFLRARMNWANPLAIRNGINDPMI